MSQSIPQGRPRDAAPAQASCPCLGLDLAPRDHRREADAAHRCFREAAATAPTAGHQLLYCLGSTYAECPVFELGWAEAVRRSPKVSQEVRANAPMPGGPPMPVGWGRSVAAIAGLLVASGALFGGSVYAFTEYSHRSESTSPAAPVQTAVATAEAPASPVATQTPSATATPFPTATATQRRTYTVQPGDGYIVIAQRNGVDLDQMLRLNNRTLDTPLSPGVVLQMP